MIVEEHRARHVALHAALDELLADFIHQKLRMGRLSAVSVVDLMAWSHAQTTSPTELVYFTYDEDTLELRKLSTLCVWLRLLVGGVPWRA
jgi:hypothetical protein